MRRESIIRYDFISRFEQISRSIRKTQKEVFYSLYPDFDFYKHKPYLYLQGDPNDPTFILYKQTLAARITNKKIFDLISMEYQNMPFRDYRHFLRKKFRYRRM